MKKSLIVFLVLLAAVMLSVPAMADTMANRSQAASNGVTLGVWKDSSPAEQYAFLLGMMTMVELEKNWQGDDAPPLRDSLISSWSLGLCDLTFKQIADTVNEYIAQNPGDTDRQVVEVLWFKLVQPKLTAAETK